MVRFDFETFAAAMFGAACRPLCVQAGNSLGIFILAWSREIGAHGASYSFWHVLPPLPAGRYMLLVSVIDAFAQDHEASTLATVSMKTVDVREGQDRAANGTCLRHSYQRIEAREEDGSLGQVANTNGEQRVPGRHLKPGLERLLRNQSVAWKHPLIRPTLKRIRLCVQQHQWL